MRDPTSVLIHNYGRFSFLDMKVLQPMSTHNSGPAVIPASAGRLDRSRGQAGSVLAEADGNRTHRPLLAGRWF